MVTLNKFIVEWEHHVDEGASYCVLKDQQQEHISTGVAKCSEKDQFNREVGRKVSLKRALDSAGLDKKLRTSIWNEYFSRKTKKRIF